MQNNTRTKSMLGTGLIVFSAFIAAMTLVPGAAAHECHGLEPDACGDCSNSKEAHDHYVGPANYCWSCEPEDDGDVGIPEWNVGVLGSPKCKDNVLS